MNTRNKSIELLRVIAMLLIVIGHYCYHGIKSSDLHSGFPVNTIGGIIEYSCMEILYIIACISVNCYVMITGYFLSDRTVFRWKGIIGVWIQTVFYGLIIWGGYLCGNNSLVCKI